MRVLVASTDGAGHYGPLVPFIQALVRRGDQVLLVVPPGLGETVARTGLPHRIGEQPDERELTPLMERFAAAAPEQAAVIANRELFGRLCTAAMLPALERACHAFGPDLVLREPCEYSSAVAAGRFGVPHAQVAVSLAYGEEASLALAAPALDPYGPQLVEQLRASPYLTRFPALLDPSPFPATSRYREPVTAGTALPDWWCGSDSPLVYLTFGSVAGGLPAARAAYRMALDAVAGLPVRALLTVGRRTEIAGLGPVPANVHVEAWVPQGDVLTNAALVVCHGGSGTILGALAAGVPLVVVPLFADQPANGRLVASAGAGLVVAPEAHEGSALSGLSVQGAPRLRAAIEQVLGEPSYRRAAGRTAAELRGSPPIDQVLAELPGEAP